MKGSKPKVAEVIPMKGAMQRPVPHAPDFMTSEGREVWGRLAPVMMSKNRLEPHYEDLFAAYCEAVADFIRHTGDLAAVGSYYQAKTRNGIQEKKRAPWGQRQDAMATMQRIGALFGMSPVDEQRISNGAQGSFLDELEKALSGTNAAD